MKKLFLKFLFPFANEKYDLEKKWWHRLIKVFFVFILILSFLGLLDEFRIYEKSNYIFFTKQNISNSLLDKELLKQFIEEGKKMGKTKEEINIAVEKANNDGAFNLNNEETQIENKGFLDLFENIGFLFLSFYFINIFLQLLYYKVFLYIIYGKK